MKLLLLLSITLILPDYGSPQENAELFQCQPSSEIRGQIFFPNIPDFYFNEQNAAAFTTANLTTLSESTTYIFTFPPRDCSGNFTTLQYCYFINTTRVNSRFAFYYINRSNLNFTISRSILFTPSASEEDCTALLAELRICCEVQQIDNIDIPTSEYSFGFASSNMQFLSFSDSARTFQALRLQATIGIIHFSGGGGGVTIGFGGGTIPERPIALLRFLKDSEDPIIPSTLSEVPTTSQTDSSSGFTVRTPSTGSSHTEESKSTSPDFKTSTTISRSNSTLESINVSNVTSTDKNAISWSLIIGGTTAVVIIASLCAIIGGLVLIYRRRGRKRVKPEMTKASTYDPGENITSNSVVDSTHKTVYKTASVSSKDSVTYATPHAVEKVTAVGPHTKACKMAPVEGKIRTSENLAYNTASMATGLHISENVAYDVALVAEKVHTGKNIAYNKANVVAGIPTINNIAYSTAPVAKGIHTRENVAYNKAATGKIHIKENVAYTKTGSIWTERNVAYTTNCGAADNILVDTNECYNTRAVSRTIDHRQQHATQQVDEVSSNPQQLVYDYVIP